VTHPGACILGCSGPNLTTEERAFFAEAQPWGFILFARNVETPEQLLRLTEGLRASVGRNAPVLIDQEGGRVQRMRAPIWREWVPPLDDAARANKASPRAMYLRYRLIASELRSVGIDVNCAPMLDLARKNTHSFLRNRCYGNDPTDVVALGRAVADGLLAGGVLPVMKHIPGHGAATLDSHETVPVVDLPSETLETEDFAPFRALCDLPMAMTGHIIYTAFDAERPATISPTLLGKVRADIGFDGLIMTDDISMGALSGDPGTRSAAALSAGCDLALHCNGTMTEMEQVVHAVGTMTELAAARAARALVHRQAPDATDLEALAAEYERLTHG